MELRHLRYFVAIAEERSFRRASLRLHISQPPLSRQMRQLEEQAGVKLLERTATGIEVTDAGAIFLEEARRALKIAEDAVEKSRRAARGEVGHLEIAYYGSVVFGPLPRFMASFRRIEPDVTLNLSNLPKDRQIRALRDGWLDIGFARSYHNEPDIATEAVAQEPVVLAVNANHPLVARETITMKALRDEPMIVFPRWQRPSFADEIVRFCDQAGFVPYIVQEAEDISSCLALVSTGMGIALVPSSAANLHVSDVRFIRIVRPVPKSPLSCVYRKEDRRPLLHSFLATIRDIAAG